MNIDETHELLESLAGAYQGFRTTEKTLEAWFNALRHIEYPAIRRGLADWIQLEERAPQSPKSIADVSAKYRVRTNATQRERIYAGLRSTQGQCDIEDAMDAFGGDEVSRAIAGHLGIDLATFKPHEMSKVVALFKDPVKHQAYKDFRAELGEMARESLGKR